jgi:hypothetical protein
MLEQQRFEFGGGDAEGFVFNHFFLAINDEERAISVEKADIARVEPANAQDARRFLQASTAYWTANTENPPAYRQAEEEEKGEAVKAGSDH